MEEKLASFKQEYHGFCFVKCSLKKIQRLLFMCSLYRLAYKLLVS